ncbi:MAG: hypothetical protein WEB57_04360 [Pseudohongiellaceae bacterium]
MSVMMICRRSRRPDSGTGDEPHPLWQNVCDFAARHGQRAPQLCVLDDFRWSDPFSGPVAQTLESVAAPGDWLLTAAPMDLISSCQDMEEAITWLTGRDMNWFDLSLQCTMTDPNASIDLRMLIHSLAQVERQRAGERIMDVKRRQRDKGRYLGGSRPFGYMVHENGRLIENPMEQRVLKRILQLRAQGRSLRAIAGEVSTPLTPVSFKTVQRILQRHV